MLIEMVYCRITGKTRDLPKIHHFIPLQPWEVKKIKGNKMRMKSVVEMSAKVDNVTQKKSIGAGKREQIKLVLDMSNEGPMFKMLESMLGGAGAASNGNAALKKLLKSGIPGLEGILAGGQDGFAKMSDDDKKRFLAAVTGVGGKIDGKAAAALIAAAASCGDPEIANKIIEKMMSGLGDEIDPSMMAALMATTALVARGASNEEILAAMRRELANSGLSEEEILAKTMLLQKALAGDNSPAFVNKTLKSALSAANLTPEDLARVLIAEKAFGKTGASPALLAKVIQLQKALSDKGVPAEMIADAITELMAENGALNIPDLTNLLQNGITSEDVSKIIALSKSFANNTPLNIPDNIDSKDAVKAALRLAFNGDLDQFAKTVLAQKAMAVSGATPEQVAKVVFLTKSMAENGMSVSEIANALTMAMSMPDGPSKSQIQLLEQLIHEALNDGKGLNEADITMLLSLSDAMNNIEGSMPPEVVRLFKKAMKQRRGSVDNVADTLMSSLTASGESRENVAKAMIRALKATGASPEEIAKTMQQAMEKAGATPEEMARVMAQAMVESGASPEEIAQVLKATFAKAMAANPAAAAEIARSMAEALAASGASAEDIAATLQDALAASLANATCGEHLDELIDLADTVAKSMAEAGASPQEIAVAMKAAFAAAGKSDDPFVAEELAISMAKALVAAGASTEDIVKALQESLKATGASKESIAQTLLTAVATSGASAEDIAKTMQTLLADSGLSEEEIQERVLQAMIEAGATPESIAKVMVHQKLLQVIGKSPEELSKVLLKQLRSGEEITLKDLNSLLSSGGISIEDAGKAVLFQKAMSQFNIGPDDIARGILLQKTMVSNGTPREEIIETINQVLQESGLDLSAIDLETLTSRPATPDDIKKAFQFDKVLEAGGVTLDGLRSDTASKQAVSNAVKEMLHCNGATPQGVIGALLLQKIMTSLNIPPDAIAKMVLLEKSLYDSGISPQDIVQLLQLVASDQKVNLVTLEPKIKESLVNNVTSADIIAVCDLVDAFHGARVAPEMISKIILLQKTIESGISTPESTVRDLCAQLKVPGVNPADLLESFNEVLKKNKVSVEDVGKASLIQKAAAGAGLNPSALTVLLDLQNALVSSGVPEEEISKVLNELVKGADFSSISKAMMAALENPKLREDDLVMGCKIAGAVDKSASGSSKLAKLLSKENNLKNLSHNDLVNLLKKVMQDSNCPSAEDLAKAIALQTLLSNSNCDPDKLAKALRITNAMVNDGVPTSTVSRMLHEALEDYPSDRKQALEDVKKPLKDLQSSVATASSVNFLQKYQAAMAAACATIDNLKDIFENAMACVGLTKEDVAKAAMVQKTLSASGVTPQVLAQAVLFQRALAASGLSPEEIVGILNKVTSPKFSESEIRVLLAKALENRSVCKEDIEAISKMQKTLRSGNLGVFGEGGDELQHLIAAGEVDMEILGKAILMQKILSASGLSPEDLGKAILLQQGMLDAGASFEGIANCMHKTLMESDISLDQLVALMQLGLMQSDSLCPDDIRNTLMFDKVLGAAAAAKILAKKISPKQMKLLQATVNSSKEGGSAAIIAAMKGALAGVIDPVSLQAMEVSAAMAQSGASKEDIEEMMALLLSQGQAVSQDFLCAIHAALSGGGSAAERLEALRASIDDEVNSVASSLRNTFMNKIPTPEDIANTCNTLASKMLLGEDSITEVKLALVDLLDEALLDVTAYEPDADMIFNYLMVSALAGATDLLEKKNLKPTGDLLQELAREQMISMLERLFLEADVGGENIMQALKESKNLAELQETLRNLLDDPKMAGAFRRQVAFLFDFEEIEHTTVAGLAMQDILKDAKHRLRPWELNKHRKVRGLRRAKVPQLTYSQVYCFYKVLPKHTDGPTIGFDYE